MKVLVVDDDSVTVDLLKEILEGQNYLVRAASSGESARDLLKKEVFQLVLSDIKMFGVDGFDILEQVRKNSPQTVVILMTAFGSVETAVEAIKQGAFDYISKPFNINELKSLISRAKDHWAASQKSSSMPAISSSEIVHAKKTLVGRSRAIVEVYRGIARAAVSDSNILILGESGTGKELVAREIHAQSRRSLKPFIAVNCGAIVDTLLESELFGHVKGAFTGAVADKRGLFEEASDGTLFLDEIGDISMSLQIKLLRVLQEGELKRVGSNQVRSVNVRVVAATHRKLEEMAAAGNFREDLYYRLKIVTIELPPLRDRIEDLNELLSYFIPRYSARNEKLISHVSDEALEILRSYNWPGNIRELENAIEHAVVMSKTSVLHKDDFPKEIILNSGKAGIPKTVSAPLPSSLEELEKKHILETLQKSNYNKSKTAEILGIDRVTLYRKAQRYKISLDSKKPN